MNERIKQIIAGTPAGVFQPEAGAPAHVTDFDTFIERLNEAEADYEDARAEYFMTDPGSEAIMAAAERTETAARELISRALTLFNMYSQTCENKDKALKILDRMTKESSIRERTCCQYYRRMRAAGSENTAMLHRLYQEKLKRMKFLDRCVNTQSAYTKRFLKNEDAGDPESESRVKIAAKAERTRAVIPQGCRFCPPRIFPPEPIPEGQPVPLAPDPYRRFKKMEAKDLVFNKDHFNFELPEGYVSEDGLIDSESVAWDYEARTVTMKYRGGVPVTWNFKQYIDPRDVPKPDEWITRYYMRLFAQAADEDGRMLFRHFPRDEEIPEYNRIPEK